MHVSECSMSSVGLDPWWECDLCDAWLDLIGPQLVGTREWNRRRQLRYERKALLALTGIGLGALFGASLMVVPQMVWLLGRFVLSVLYWSIWLLVMVYAPLTLLAILLGMLTC